MAVKDEVSIVMDILKKPKIALGYDAAKSIAGMGSSATITPMSERGNVAELSESDRINNGTKFRPKLNDADVRSIKEDSNSALSIMGIKNTAGERRSSGPVSLEEGVDSLFGDINQIDDQIKELAGKTGRVGAKMLEHWEGLMKRAKAFEVYYDRSMQRLDE